MPAWLTQALDSGAGDELTRAALLADKMLRSPLFGRWLGLSGMALALGVATGRIIRVLK